MSKYAGELGLDSREKQLPCIHVELDKDQAKQAKGFKPGQMVKMTLVGKITSLSFRTPTDPEEGGFEGNVSVEMTQMDIGLSQKNAIAELLDEDE